jgi:hypothetical protein
VRDSSLSARTSARRSRPLRSDVGRGQGQGQEILKAEAHLATRFATPTSTRRPRDILERLGRARRPSVHPPAHPPGNQGPAHAGSAARYNAVRAMTAPAEHGTHPLMRTDRKGRAVVQFERTKVRRLQSSTDVLLILRGAGRGLGRRRGMGRGRARKADNWAADGYGHL